MKSAVMNRRISFGNGIRREHSLEITAEKTQSVGVPLCALKMAKQWYSSILNMIDLAQEYIEGPCDLILNTANLPVLASIIGLAYDGGTPFQAEVYFINLARIVQVKFGVPFFDIYDPRFMDFGVPVAVRGTISFQIQDYREFIKLNRLHNFTLEDFQKQIRDTVIRYVKDTVANAPSAHNIPVIQIESKTAQINDAIEYDIKERLKENFGVLVSGVDVGAIEIDKTSEGYRQLMAVTKDIAAIRIEAETQDYVERLRIQREEGQYAHTQTDTDSQSSGPSRLKNRRKSVLRAPRPLARWGRMEPVM